LSRCVTQRRALRARLRRFGDGSGSTAPCLRPVRFRHQRRSSDVQLSPVYSRIRSVNESRGRIGRPVRCSPPSWRMPSTGRGLVVPLPCRDHSIYMLIGHRPAAAVSSAARSNNERRGQCLYLLRAGQTGEKPRHLALSAGRVPAQEGQHRTVSRRGGGVPTLERSPREPCKRLGAAHGLDPPAAALVQDSAGNGAGNDATTGNRRTAVAGVLVGHSIHPFSSYSLGNRARQRDGRDGLGGNSYASSSPNERRKRHTSTNSRQWE